MAMRTGVVLLVAVALSACPRADAPDQPDTALISTPADVQFPPIDAPGDTASRPVLDPSVPATAGQPPRTAPAPARPAPATPAPGGRDTFIATPSDPLVDTLRGRVALVGAAPMMQVTLRRTGQQDMTLHGGTAMMRSLRSVQGLEIQVAGHRMEPQVMHVDRFAVRAAEGVPAVDGTLQQDGQGYLIASRDGTRHRVAHLPEPLRARVGQRVWIAGPLDREPEAFGVVD